MKLLFFVIVCAAGLSFATAEYSQAEQDIIENVADAFQVAEEDVTLNSPNLVLVSLGLTSETGLAEFTPYGENQTAVKITFPSRTIEAIVDELGGL